MDTVALRGVAWATALMLSASTAFGQVKAQIGVRPKTPAVAPAPNNGPQPQPAPDQPTVATVWALAYATSSDGKHFGTCSPVRITAASTPIVINPPALGPSTRPS